MHNMKSALVHDWLIGMGGGEKVLQAINEIYPSPIYTLVKNEQNLNPAFLADKSIDTSFLQKLPFAKKFHRYFLPFYPLAIEQFDLSKYDIVLSTSHAVAKGALTHSQQLHLCYCFTPMRYAWDLYHQYLSGVSGIQRKLAKVFLHYLRNWDINSVSRVDHFACISKYIQRRIQKIYGRESTVIYPPVATHLYDCTEKKEDFYLTASRMVPYKKIDLIVEAFSKTPDRRLVVIGDGPEMKKVKAKATSNIEILGHTSDACMKEYLQKAKAFVFAAEEDFGIIVVEAQAAGTPVIAFGKGGSLETIQEGKTGIFYDEQTVPSLIEAVNKFERQEEKFVPSQIKAHAESFSEERFKREFKAFVEKKWEEFRESNHSCRR